jgi:tRNA U34 5-carboxymethylaminomethyl modifying GTPase MnmE/TrmE
MQAFVRSSTLAHRRCLLRSTGRLEGLGSGLRPSRTSCFRTQIHCRALSSNTNTSYTRRKDVAPRQDTIYALSTAPGRAAIAVIRISGPSCLDIYESLCPDAAFPVPRVATLRKLRDPENNTRVLDPGALILYFPAPATVTGEDVLELHCHGGVAIVRSVLDAIASCGTAGPGRERRNAGEYSSVRAAEAGEFTKRAFYNGVMDLVQAEGLGEALAAETEMQRRLAVDSQSGGLAGRYEEWRALLLEARGEMEALIDFSEDQHFDESPRELVQSVAKQVLGLRVLIERHVLNARKGELLREGVSVALLGAPNAGKSSLLNLIVGREAAIVSAEAGTTRDIVDVSVDLNGWLVRLGDMAGLRGLATSGKALLDDMNEALRRKERDTLGLKEEATSIGAVEQEGMRRARARALESDVLIMLLPVYVDGTGAPAIDLATELVDAVSECKEAGKEVLFVLNKIDLVPDDQATAAVQSLKDVVKSVFPDARDEVIVNISCRNASFSSPSAADPGNIQHLLRTLTSLFADMTSASGPSVPGMQQSQAYWQSSLSISHRQAQYLLECLTHLDNFLEMSAPPSAQAQGGHYYDNHADIAGEKSDNRTWVSTETMLDHQPYYSTYSRYPISESDLDIVLSAEHLRAAAVCLAKITGRGEGGDVEDVLGVVFEKFCVGK